MQPWNDVSLSSSQIFSHVRVASQSWPGLLRVKLNAPAGAATELDPIEKNVNSSMLRLPGTNNGGKLAGRFEVKVGRQLDKEVDRQINTLTLHNLEAKLQRKQQFIFLK